VAVDPWKKTRHADQNPETGCGGANPYYYAVDTREFSGSVLRQDARSAWALAENLESSHLRAIAGNTTRWSATRLGKLPASIFEEESAARNYTIHLDPVATGRRGFGTCNKDYQADPEVGKWLRSVELRNAMGDGEFDTDQLKEVSDGDVQERPGSFGAIEGAAYSTARRVAHHMGRR